MMSGEIDSWVAELDGLKFRVDLDPDYEANSAPEGQGDCYSPSDLAAHAMGLWSFVGVTVSPMVAGLDGEELSQALWGVEYGTMPAETEPHEGGQHGETVIDRASIGRYPVRDLASEVRAELRKFRTVLDALPLDDCPAAHERTEGIPHPATVACERSLGHLPPHRVTDYSWTD